VRISAIVGFTPGNRALALVIGTAVQESVFEVGSTLLSRAKTYCPVDTGALRDSIDMTLSDDKRSAVIAPGVPYDAYVEFGTGIRGAASPGAGPFNYDANWPGMVAQPYMRPALDEVAGTATATFADNIRGVLR